jgi:ribose transport system ATP-binding protein
VLDTRCAPALRVEGLRFRGQRGDAPLAFELRYGEIVGLAGLVGSGRTETVRAIFGADPAVAGQVFRDGRAVHIDSPRAAIAEGICLLTENRKDEGLILDMPIRANVTLAHLAAVSNSGLMQAGTEADAARRMAADLQIRLASIDQPVRELSGGNQQKVVLGRWLLRECRVLLLDEPTRGVDVATKAEIYRIIAGLAGEGMGVLVVSSETVELLGMCNRILVMREGELVADLDAETATELEILRHSMPGTQQMVTAGAPAADSMEGER